MNREDMLEALAAIEHEQWKSWSQQLSRSEKLSPERLLTWRLLWVPYSALPDEMKELDREWARKVLKVLIGDPGEWRPACFGELINQWCFQCPWYSECREYADEVVSDR